MIYINLNNSINIYTEYDIQNKNVRTIIVEF